MVKKTQGKYLAKAIKKTGVSFFAVALIAATSIAIYLGIQSGAVAMLKQADRYFRENHLASVETACANGITQTDVEELAGQSFADTVEGGYQTMVLMDGESETLIVQVRSLLQDMNQPVLIEGELPSKAQEVAVEQKFASEQGISLGDEIRIEHDGELLYDTFCVTAIINEPSFSCGDIEDARGRDEVGTGSASYYMEVMKDAFDVSYYDYCYTTVYVENNALSELYFYSDEYAQLESELVSAVEAFGKERASLRYNSLTQDAEEKLCDAENELNDAKAELADGEAEFSEREQLLTADQRKAAEADLAGARQKIEDAETELADARQKAEEIEQKDWIVSARNNMGDVSAIEIIVEGLFTLSYSFALIFLLVAIVVCYAAVVKMIDDERMLIGAQKALGFTTKEIFFHYLSYNVLSAILGIILGWVCGVIIVENLVLYVFRAEFLYEKIPLTFVWKEAVIVAGLCLAIFIVATFAGCFKVIRQPAVSLLRGELPTQKKAYFFESWGIYKKLKLYSRTMIKNVLGDKGRILTMIMGVVGCMSLLIITFTLKFSISGATDVQFENYFLYENRLVVNSEEADLRAYEQVLDEEGISYRRIQDKLQNFRLKGEDWTTIHAIAVDDIRELEGFLYLEDIESGREASLPSDGALISRKCAENKGLQAGSVIELMDAEGNPRECRVAGVVEHYLPYHQIVMTTEYYQEVMGEDADACIFLLKGDISGLYEKVADRDGFMSLRDNSEYKNTFSSINLVIGICLTFSAILAVLVLFNQINMYINRKAKELAVMRINGYTRKETKQFVSRDNVVLVALGLLAGCIIGTPLAQLEVRIMETGASRYITTPNLLACFLSVIICSVFAIVINKLALRKIDHLNLTNVSGN